MAQTNLEKGDPRQEGGNDHQATGNVFRRPRTNRRAKKTGYDGSQKRKKDNSVIHGPVSPSSC